MSSAKKFWKHGDKVPMEDIEVGDFITFKTPDQPDKSGVVARLLDLGEQDNLRKIAYLDKFGYVLNGYPDQVTTAHWTVTKEEQIKAEKIEKKKSTRQFKYFERKKPGTIYGYEVGKYTNYLFVKTGENQWVWIEAGSRGSFEVAHHQTDDWVFEHVLNEDGSLMRELH